MRRKMLGAILLPIPFAALPVLVVLAGALFGGKGSDSSELVTTRDQTPALQERVSTDSVTTTDDSTLARVTSQNEVQGCGDDLSADF